MFGLNNGITFDMYLIIMYMSETKSRYLDPLSKFGFKHLFGAEAHKEVLMDFLKAHFAKEKQIVNVVTNPISCLGNGKPYQKTLLDLVCTEKNGHHFAVEIHYLKAGNFFKKNKNFVERYYRHQASIAQENSPYFTDESYMLGFLSFTLTREMQHAQFEDYCAITLMSKERTKMTLGFRFAEFLDWDEASTKLNTSLDKWIYLLQHMPTATEIPSCLNHGIFPQVFAFAEIAGLTVEERMEYEAEIARR